MDDAPVTVRPDLTLQRFLDDVVRTQRFSAYPVMADGEAIGLVSFRDGLAVPREQRQRLRVRDRMLPRAPVLVVHSDGAADVMPELAREEPRRGHGHAGRRWAGRLRLSDAPERRQRGARPLPGVRHEAVGGRGSGDHLHVSHAPRGGQRGARRTGETVDILLDVSNPGLWMAHCHIAEHHESGMMFSFEVTE